MSDEGQFTEGGELQNDGNEFIDDEDDVNAEHAWKTPGGTLGGPEVEESDDDQYKNGGNKSSANNVDLCILSDVTDSMTPWTKQVRRGIRQIVNELKGTFGIGKLRLSFIGYRDWDDDGNNDGYPRIEKLQFTTDITRFEQFVKECKSVAGGDAAEDVLGGIQETLKLSWKAPIRVVYHICDAPAHGTMYHDLYDKLKAYIKPKKKKELLAVFDALSDSESDEEHNDDEEEVIMMAGKGDKENEADLKKEEEILRAEFDKWPNKHANDPKHEDLFLELKKQQIQFFIGTQTQFTDKMVSVFETYCKSIDYELKTMDLANTAQFLPTLIKAVSTAVRVVFKRNMPEIKLNLDELRKKKVNFKVHCGIDFGTAGSGFAYALAGKNEVYTDQNWSGSKHVDVKTKTNILLDRDGNCIAFGDDATDKYVRTDSKDLFFERFKMALYEKKLMEKEEKEKEKGGADGDDENYRIDIREELEAANGEKLASRKVLEEAIRFMKEHAMKNLRQKLGESLRNEEVQWILTVPAIWSDQAKSVMQTAAVNAGMVDPKIDGQLIIAYEPDCASLSIQHELNEELRLKNKQEKEAKQRKLKAGQNVAVNQEQDEDKKDDDELQEEEEMDTFFEVGDKVILCDLGGGTADIACHQLDEHGGMREIAAPSGGAWGSTYVDEHFLELLRDMFGAEWMEEFRREHPSKYIDILQNFRAAKANYKVQDKKNKTKIKKKQYDSTYHNVKVNFTFIEFMQQKAEEQQEKDGVVVDEQDEHGDGDEEEEEEEALDKLVANYRKFGKQGLVRLNEDYLELSYTVWNWLFDLVVHKIVEHVQCLLDSQAMAGCKYLCLAGGFSQSAHLQSAFFKRFGTKSKYEVCIFTPKRPILSVVDGAARMGLNPHFISARTIGKSYGIAIQKDLEEFKSIYPSTLIPKDKIGKRAVYRQHSVLSKNVINDVFLPFVRKNTLIKQSDKAIIYWLEPADIQSDKIEIRLFDSNEEDPKFVEPHRQNAKIDLHLDEKVTQPIPIIFIFNDTTIRVFVEMPNNNEQYKEVTINFDVAR
eukprot:CAMPEP_0197025488 /NCGR_PEP_ID=MMETSP1384-20130603/5811_1 /TAXON_ID=29189 /ORGANISM="Ammonia sp." /LENGTH=1044 /DNA_ID=CAMNT_0042454023 /DNA_START=14 /DNA_END=3148 /DNA_ORIENTATION=-